MRKKIKHTTYWKKKKNYKYEKQCLRILNQLWIKNY